MRRVEILPMFGPTKSGKSFRIMDIVNPIPGRDSSSSQLTTLGTFPAPLRPPKVFILSHVRLGAYRRTSYMLCPPSLPEPWARCSNLSVLMPIELGLWSMKQHKSRDLRLTRMHGAWCWMVQLLLRPSDCVMRARQ